MVRTVVEAFLGDVGRSILAFYEANSLWINGIILLYGLLIVLSWTNYKKLRHQLLVSVIDQLRKKNASDLHEAPEKLLGGLQIPWEEAIAGTRFPLVAEQSAFWPKRLKLESLQKMIGPENLVKDAVMVLTHPKTKKKAA